MPATRAKKRTGFTLTLAVAALAAVAIGAFGDAAAFGGASALATSSRAGTGAAPTTVQTTTAGIDFNLSAAQASYGLRYQCMQDFRQCTRAIAVTSSWTAELAQQAFDAEYATCCYEAELCGDFLGSLGSRVITRDYGDDIAAACAVINDAQSAVWSGHETLMRKARADAAR